MRLLLLITDLELGGTPIVVRELATRLRSESLHVEVACLKPAGVVAEQLRQQGVTVTSFEAQRVLDLPGTIRSLTSLVRDRQIDTVLSLLVHANFIASRAAPHLPRVRFVQSIQTTQPRPRWHWWLQRRIHMHASHVVVPSESVARRAVEWCGVPRQKIVVIPNAVNVQTFRGTGVPPVKNHGRDGHATVFNVGFVGRLDPVKRVGDLIAAIASLPPTIHLAIYGDGAMRPQIEHAITLTPGLDGRVVLHGMIANPREAYEKIDVLVLPSVAEGFGLVLIEAMAAGVPVIGTNVDGIRDVIEHEQTGLLVPPRDPRALAAAITLLREDAALRERLVQTARTEVQRRFAWPAVLRSYRELLDQREPLPRQDGQDQSL